MSPAKDALAIVGSCLVLGVVCGVLWWMLVDPPTYTKVRQGGSMSELQLGQRFDGDGWYAVIAVVSGLFTGAVLTWWRSRDFVVTTMLLLVGAAVAALVMAVTGRLLGPGDPDVALAAADLGEGVPEQLNVTVATTYLVWPIAVLVGALMVLWSQPRGEPRGEPGAEPDEVARDATS